MMKLTPLSDFPDPPPTRVKVDRKYVTIRPEGDAAKAYGRSGYWFDLKRADTPEKALGWIVHLASKRWFTTRMARDLACQLAERFGWNVMV